MAYGPSVRGAVTECATPHQACSASGSKNAFRTTAGGRGDDDDTSRPGVAEAGGLGLRAITGAAIIPSGPSGARAAAGRDGKVAGVCPSSRWRISIPSFSRAAKRGRSGSSSEYLEPLRRFREQKIQDTVVFFGSARVDSRERAERALRTLRARGVQRTPTSTTRPSCSKSRRAVEWARFYEEARELARLLTALER